MEVDTEQVGTNAAAVSQNSDAQGPVTVTVKWKFTSFAVEIDPGQSCEVLKHQIFSLTQVPPDDQFLIGVYQPGEDAILQDLDLKTSQTLILLGEPARAPPAPASAGLADTRSLRTAAGSDADSSLHDIKYTGVGREAYSSVLEDTLALARERAAHENADARRASIAHDATRVQTKNGMDESEAGGEGGKGGVEADEDEGHAAAEQETTMKAADGNSTSEVRVPRVAGDAVDMPMRGLFSFVARAKQGLDYLASLQDNVTGLAQDKVLSEVAERLNKTRLFTQVGNGANLSADVAVAGDEGAGGGFCSDPESAPTTLPREFWHKKLVDYTAEERARLKAWLNETRQWRVGSTKIASEEKAKAELLLQEEEELKEHQALVDELIKAHETKLNRDGLSMERSREIIMKGLDLFPLPHSEPTTNTTLLAIRNDPVRMQQELAGGLAPENNDQWRADLEWLGEWLEERMELTREEALREHARDEVNGAALDAALAEESEESLLDFEHMDDSMADEVEEDGELVFADVGPDGKQGKRRRLSQVVISGCEKLDPPPLGLENLGNTCYMAAALQILRAVPELVRGVLTTPARTNPSADAQDNLLQALRLLYLELTDHKDMVKPYTMIHHLRQLVPAFAECGPMGPMQQDAEECLAAVMQALDAGLPRSDATPGAGAGAGGLVRELFEIELVSSTKCAEPGVEEVAEITRDRVMRLALNIESKTNVIHDAIKTSLNYQVDKFSPTLHRDAVHNVTAEIARLPPYLAVQFVRFYWRKDTKKKAKICRNVYFPTVLDMLPYCTEAMRIPIERELARRRAEYMKANPVWDDVDNNDEMAVKWAQMDQQEAEDAEKARLARLKTALASGMEADTEEMRIEMDEAQAMMEMERAAAEEERSNLLTSKNMTNAAAGEESGDSALRAQGAGTQREARLLGCSKINHSALYKLRAIITHEGRYADAGHYIAWVKTGVSKRLSEKGAPQPIWLKFDDEKVSEHTEEEVKLTAGGADGPIAYVCLYGRSSAVAEGISEQHQGGHGSRTADVY